MKIKNNSIYKVGEKDTLIGTYKTEAIPNYSATRIRVYDAQNFLTATYELGTILFFDSNKIKFSAEKSSLIGNAENVADNAKNVIGRMIIAGYTLGDMQAVKADIRRENHKEAVKAEMKTSVNIYKQLGTITDGEGKEIKGEITVEFEELKSTKSGMASLDNYGGVATLKTVNEKGKFTYTDYKARNGVKFCIDATNKCYLGMRANDAFAAKFNEEIEVTDNLSLYKSHFLNNVYYFKKSDKDKALKIVTSSLLNTDTSEKMFEKIFEYLKDCPDLKSTVNTSEIDLKNETDLKAIVTAFTSFK
ncbi:hypothetical protein LX77_03836 [Gelidibacter algens]|uniref:Uncharacterized protein n=1 Tax=Gelidibacter algens TaxID=49280 RepID=A0A1A7R0L3_9FLAO|nr:hypothetical protein [Gelidibacter algens]OBX25790.1 hypothetical protein A9996_07605 [Gelidibacter algens]RAJ17730.1 hypothetical protein LX77_03836 [Gelidibacter algens]